MISKTKIKERTSRKTNPVLAKTLKLALENELMELCKKLAKPSRQIPSLNLSELNQIKEDKIIFCGKILGSGELEKKMKISALAFSKKAKEKLKKLGCEINTIKEEIESNKKLAGVKII
ncbi:MAG: uL15 family ribosomal protein [Candidatus Nanoarchaeia archaeon]